MEDASRLFKALSDDTRLRILGLLVEGELCVCDLVAILELPQSTVSRHLACLRNAGLVSDSRQGMWMHYRLADGGTTLHEDVFELLRRNLAALPQAKADRKKLRGYTSKKRASCA